MPTTSDPTINIPQLIVLAVIAFLAFRWYNSSPTPTTANSNAESANRTRTGGNRGRPVNMAAVEQVMGMFPQLERRSVMWDLQRNGGNVGATTERVLEGRGLEVPPPSFNPPLPTPPASTSTANTASTSSTKQTPNPDLITRYNLNSRVPSEKGKGKAIEEAAPEKPSWAATKTDRAAALQRRREEMVLAARRKFLEEEERRKGAS